MTRAMFSGVFPRDVEQLAFYSVMRTARVSDNYLVFITQSEPLRDKGIQAGYERF